MIGCPHGQRANLLITPQPPRSFYRKMEEEKFCAICKKVECDFETRFRQHFHRDCLKECFDSVDKKCPLCMTPIGLNQKFEKAIWNESDMSDFSMEELHEFVGLLISCKKHSVKAPLKRLIKSGWDFNEKYPWISSEPSTLFNAAINSEHYEMAFKLLKYGAGDGADFKVMNNEGFDVLGVFIKYYCCNKLNYKSFKTAEKAIGLMIDAGCDANAVDLDGKSPIHYICEYQQDDLLELLLKKGVDASVLPSNGEYPFEFALQKNPFSSIIEILELSKHNRGRSIVRNLRIRNCDACSVVCCSLTGRCGHNLHVSCMKGKSVCPVCQTKITPFDAVERFLAQWMKIKLDEENASGLALISKKAEEYFENGLKALNRTELLALLENACERTEIPYGPLVKQLIKMEVPLGYLILSDIYPENILLKACLYDHYDLVSDLFELEGEDVVDSSARDEKGNSLLHIACLGKSLKTVKFLLNKAKMNVNEPNYSRITPFHVACVQGDKEIVLECLSAAIDLSVLIDGNVDYFLFACENSKPEILKILRPLFNSPLLKQLPYICGNSRESFGDYFKEYDEIEIHKKTGAEKLQMFEEALSDSQNNLLDEPQCLRVALNEAIKSGCFELFDLLMEVLKGTIDPESDYKYLIDAAKCGNYEIFRKLLDLGFDPSKSDEFGFTPLIGACQGGNLKIVKTLIDLGVDVNAVNSRELKTALFTTCVFSNDNAETLNALIENGADINVIGHNGLNALSRACICGNVPIVKRLLELGLTDPYQGKNPNHCLLSMAIFHTADDDNVLEIAKMIAPTAAAEMNKWAMAMAYNSRLKKTYKFLKNLNGF